MAYKLFTQEQVFDVPSLNTLCDRLVNYNGSLILTGAAAAMVNGDASIAAVRAVIFITGDKMLFNSLKNELSNLLSGAAISSYSDRYQIEIYRLKLEIWLSGTAITTNNTDGIITQITSEIPSNLT
jgi:hypothetical protein